MGSYITRSSNNFALLQQVISNHATEIAYKLDGIFRKFNFRNILENFSGRGFVNSLIEKFAQCGDA